MVFDLEYVRNYMNELDEITGFNSKDIELYSSKRMTRSYAYNQMKFDKDGNCVNWRQKYSDAILNCDISEEEFKDIIGHEYCHAWADYGTKYGYGHSAKEYIDKCNIIGCNPNAINENKNIENKYYAYLDKVTKNNNPKKVNYRKYGYEVITRGLKYNSDVITRLNVLEDKKYYNVNLIIYNKYGDCRDLDFIFNQHCEDMINRLEKTNGVKILNYNLDYKLKDRMYINYMHRKGVIG